jgi:guanosine-3',5'-bis(diphosphate) 3'-pyrophosphohydrolase
MMNILIATNFAATAHSGQRRKNIAKDPYINHPIEVAALLAVEDIGVDKDVLVAALLHDTIEDTSVTRDDIVERFGARVAAIVAECSDDKSLPKVERKKVQIEHAAQVSYSAALVKLADKLSNLSSLKMDPPAKWTESIVRGYVVWSYAVVQALRSVVEKNGVKHLKILDLLDVVFASFGVKEQNADALQAYYDELEKE